MWLEGETKSEWKIVTFLQLQSDRHPFRVTFFELRKKATMFCISESDATKTAHY